MIVTAPILMATGVALNSILVTLAPLCLALGLTWAFEESLPISVAVESNSLSHANGDIFRNVPPPSSKNCFIAQGKLSHSLRSPKVANKWNSSRDESSEHLLRVLWSVHRLGILDKKRIIGRTSASMFRPIPDCDDRLNLQVVFNKSYLTV